MKRFKTNMILNILLISAVTVLGISLINQSKTNETVRNELFRNVSERLKRHETETRNRIKRLETKIETIKQSETHILKRIKTAEKNYRNIIRNLKSIDNAKTKKDLEIIHADSDTDWNWFNSRFPKSKSDHRLSIKTDTIIREQGDDGQH